MNIIIFFCGITIGFILKFKFVKNQKNKIEENINKYKNKNIINPKMFLNKDQLNIKSNK